MKRILILLFIFTNLGCFAQAITVNSTTYTTEQLINDVLINSPCVFGKNFNSKTGTSFGSSNGIGYFENTNLNFPFKRGVVLTTGDVNKAQGPNNTILSDGNLSWTGDADLENILLSQSGIQMKSINASFIEFEFTPKSTNFNFSFLFASEEYGTAQCNYSDAFAFLLQDVTSGTPAKNLALVPNTNIPISVETIRDGANNSGCPSANLPYFGSFNSDGFGPAINFNGQTVRMVASAAGLNINHTYRIKLVIADGGNNTQYDSAIFIEADSFNIGQDILGLDYTIENNRALCPGDSLPILLASGLKPETNIIWQKDGVSFSPEQTGTELNLNLVDPDLTPGIHTYSVVYSEPFCKGITDSILVEIYPRVDVMEVIPDFYSCNILNNVTKFDLSKQTNLIIAATNLDSATEISYHLIKLDAELNRNSLPNQYSIPNTSAAGETIFVRIKSVTNKCFEIRSFKLITNDLKFGIIPEPETLCARSFNESPISAYFNLNDQRDLLLGNLDPDLYKITFHRNQSDANSNSNQFIINFGSLISPTQTIWARLQNNSNPECFVTTNFELVVKPIPNVDKLENVFVCDSYILPRLEVPGTQYWTLPNGQGTQLFAGDIITQTSLLHTYNFAGGCPNQESFRVTIIRTDEMVPPSASYCSEYTLSQLPYGRYFRLSGGIHTPGNVELFSGNTITTIGKNTIFVWFEDLTQTPICVKENSFDITIISWEKLPEYDDQFDCSSFTLPVDPNGGTYYSGPKKKLPIIPAGTIISNTTKIYVFKENTLVAFNCKSEETFTVFIGANSYSGIKDVEVCKSYTLPKFTIKGEFRTAPDGGGSELEAGTTFTENTQIWFYVKGQSCTDKLNFTVTITKDIMPEMPNITECNIYYLPQISFSGAYYSGQSGSGTLYPVGTPIIKSQKIFFFDKFSTNVCNARRGFKVTITPSAKLDAKPVEVLICGKSYILDDLKNGEYYEFPGGPSLTNPALPPGFEITSSKTIYAFAPGKATISCKAEYSISVVITKVNPIPDQFACTSLNLPKIIGKGEYYTAPNGPNGSGTKLSFPYEPIKTTTRIYVYADNDNRISCFDEKSFLVTIYNLNVADITPIKKCDSYSLPVLIAPATRYFKKAGGPSSANVELFPNDIITKSTTIYAYAEIGSKETAKCFDEKPFEITIVQKPKSELIIPSICVDSETNIVNNAILNSGYDPNKYTFEWKKEDGTLLSTQTNFSTNAIGNYTFQVNDLRISEGCLSEKSIFTLLYSSGPKEVNYTTSAWFSENHTITINATAFPGYSDNFLYSLNGGSLQTNNTFTDLDPGTYEITVTDANLCGNSNTIAIEIKFPFYPKFFTPNGDGFNDNWKINKFEDFSTYKIFIYDRYGKLVKEILSDNDHWDGNYMGRPLPPDDYWFSISYTENNISKMFKSHFSLIR